MRSRRTAKDEIAEVARRRLELLSAELAGLRRDVAPGPADAAEPGGGAGEPTDAVRVADDGTAPPGVGRHALRQAGTRRPDGLGDGLGGGLGDGLGGGLGGWVHDRLPPTLQGRVQLGASHLTVVALIVAVAVAATAWWVVRAHPSGTPVPAAAAAKGKSPSPLVSLPAEPVGAAGATSAPTASPTGTLVVDVTGKVRRPGIATLPTGSRVVDALEAAGGARHGVDLSGLNLARVLVDGEQIVVGVRAPTGVAASAASAPGPSSGPLVNINTATESELETLPEVGPVTAAAIIKWRTDNGAFSAVDDLLQVSGIGDKTLAQIAPFVTL
jgi:competence protein ComEA